MQSMRSFVRLSIVSVALLSTPFALIQPVASAAVAPASTTWSSRTEAYIDAARNRTLEAAEAKGIELPRDYLAWIDGDPVVRMSVYGCRADALPVLLKLRSLEIDLGEDTVRRDYTQLALAFAIQDSYAKRGAQGTPWNDADGAKSPEALPDVSSRAPLSLEIPGDPRVRVDTKDPSRPLDRDDHIINFLEDHPEIEEEIEVKELPPLEYDDKGIAKPQRAAVAVKKKIKRPLRAADVIASRALQEEFNAYMAAHGHPEVKLDCGERAVFWGSTEAINDKALRDRIAEAHELFHDAYRAKGRMPAARDRAPTAAESMAWFIRNDRWAFSEKDRAARAWPRFPLNAPWPVLLMLAADDQPLREREDIWLKFRDNGEFRTYGEYIGGIAQQFDMQSARRVAPIAFSYGSIQMMWKDGGVCGTMGNIGARTHRIVGQPASTAGQPGHCAIVFMEYDAKTKEYRCKGGQYATGGDEVTTVHAGWNYDDKGGRKPMVFHQSVAWGVNAGMPSFIEGLAMVRAFNAMSAEERARECVPFVKAALAENPFALAAITSALENAPDAKSALAIADACAERFEKATDAKKHALYRSTVRDLAHARIEQLPAPATADESAKLLESLERQGSTNGALLARCWRGVGGDDEFVKRCKSEIDAYLASPERGKDKRAAQKFAAEINGWAKTVARPAKKRWAEQLLVAFESKETITVRGKEQVDPAVEALRKIAGVKVPAKK
ncbi:MAG: hypothetical protein RLY21_1222 [Planctomycetota bacterium]|jgi:hypothetical protein